MAITFQSEEIKFSLPDKNKVKNWIRRVAEKEGRGVGEVNYIFCSDEYLLNINQTYLQHDTYTDIITFDYSEGESKISGDIFVSVERVKENAATFKVTFEEELKRVLIHGILHLVGFPDKTKKQAEQMRKKENEALAQYSLSE